MNLWKLCECVYHSFLAAGVLKRTCVHLLVSCRLPVSAMLRLFGAFFEIVFPASFGWCYSGHTYAGGAVLAMCHDYRVMRPDRGWFCLNEVHIGKSFNPFLLTMLQ